MCERENVTDWRASVLERERASICVCVFYNMSESKRAKRHKREKECVKSV